MDKWVLMAVWWLNGSGTSGDLLPTSYVVARETPAQCWDYAHERWAPQAHALARRWERQGVHAGFLYTCVPMSLHDYVMLEKKTYAR